MSGAVTCTKLALGTKCGMCPSGEERLELARGLRVGPSELLARALALEEAVGRVGRPATLAKLQYDGIVVHTIALGIYRALVAQGIEFTGFS